MIYLTGDISNVFNGKDVSSAPLSEFFNSIGYVDVTNLVNTFRDSNVTSINYVNILEGTNCSNAFRNANNLPSLDDSVVNFSNVSNASEMCYNVSSVTIDKMSSAIDISHMCDNGTACFLTEPLSSSITNMSGAFSNMTEVMMSVDQVNLMESGSNCVSAIATFRNSELFMTDTLNITLPNAVNISSFLANSRAISYSTSDTYSIEFSMDNASDVSNMFYNFNSSAYINVSNILRIPDRVTNASNFASKANLPNLHDTIYLHDGCNYCNAFSYITSHNLNSTVYVRLSSDDVSESNWSNIFKGTTGITSVMLNPYDTKSHIYSILTNSDLIGTKLTVSEWS